MDDSTHLLINDREEGVVLNGEGVWCVVAWGIVADSFVGLSTSGGDTSRFASNGYQGCWLANLESHKLHVLDCD